MPKHPLACARDLPVLECAVGPLAQSVEQRTFNPWVVGSSPTGPTGELVSTANNQRFHFQLAIVEVQSTC